MNAHAALQRPVGRPPLHSSLTLGTKVIRSLRLLQLGQGRSLYKGGGSNVFFAVFLQFFQSYVDSSGQTLTTNVSMTLCD